MTIPKSKLDLGKDMSEFGSGDQLCLKYNDQRVNMLASFRRHQSTRILHTCTAASRTGRNWIQCWYCPFNIMPEEWGALSTPDCLHAKQWIMQCGCTDSSMTENDSFLKFATGVEERKCRAPGT